MSLSLFVLLLLPGDPVLTAQQAVSLGKSTAPAAADSASAEQARQMIDRANRSFYHPDALQSVDCSVAVNWNDFFRRMKLDPPADRRKLLESYTSRFHAERNKTPVLTFAGPESSTPEATASKEQMESGMKQMIEGYFQSYWSLMASPPDMKVAQIGRVQKLPDGSVTLYSSSGADAAQESAKSSITLDATGVPVAYDIESPNLTSNVRLTYASSTDPATDGLPEVSHMHAINHLGATTMDVEEGFEYQRVGAFSVPKRVSMELVGSFAFTFEFTNCSVTP